MSKKVYLICNAHLDPVWQWEWEEGVAAAVSTFRTAADLCEEFDGFVFNHNEAILYRWVEEYEPRLFSRIQRLVCEGKWHIMGGWYLQPDCNMPSGESFVRQILLGRTYFQEKFGRAPSTAINFDPFGHSRGLVQILAKSGFDSYLFCRPSQDLCELASDQFVWTGFDGSEVLATRLPAYNSFLGKARETILERIGLWGDSECCVILWGVGNHGGGPSRKDLRDLVGLIADSTDYAVSHSTPEEYFAQLSKLKHTLPRINKDLNPFSVGCYTSQVRMKQRHRLLENELYSTEKMLASAACQGLLDYPKDDLKSALYDLAFSEFHDALPGSSIQPVEEMSLRVLDHGLEIISRLKARAFFALSSGQPKAAENEIPILVYNPHPFRVRTIVECEFQLADQNWENVFTAAHVHQNGRLLPSQNEKELSNLPLDWRKRVVFLADLEPSRMNRFDCRLEVIQKKPEPALCEQNGYFRFKTDDLEVEINTRTGLIDRYRVNEVNYAGPGAFKPIVIADSEDAWGMTVTSFDDVIGEFKLMSPESSARFSGVKSDALPPVRVIEDGPVRSVIEAVFEYESSRICVRYLLPKSGSEIELQLVVNWLEKDKMLKLEVPVTGSDCKYIGQTAYGINELPTNGDESVAQKWVAVVSGNRTITCINDGVHGSDFSKHGLRLTLLRSPAFTGHPLEDRTILPQDRYTSRIDQGERTFRFWFDAGDTDSMLNSIDRKALVRNEKPFALSFFPSGLGDASQPFIKLSDDVINLTAAKLSEDGNSLIMRLFEPTGKARQTIITLPFIELQYKVSLSAFEIKTLRVDVGSATVDEVDLVERPVLPSSEIPVEPTCPVAVGNEILAVNVAG
ncbi:MAG: glycoside hydrolase family 38 N-terminal domain-containing protein [Armatimonadota bacterium]